MTGSIPPSGPLSYEGQVAVPYIVKTFDPQPSNNKFPLPTIWINNDEKKAFISVSKDLGTTEWLEVGGGDIDEKFPITPYVVGEINEAGYVTIQSAINAANNAGGGTVFIQPGNYTENLTLYNAVNLWAFPGELGAIGLTTSSGSVPPVTIVGNTVINTSALNANSYNTFSNISFAPPTGDAISFITNQNYESVLSFDGCTINVNEAAKAAFSCDGFPTINLLNCSITETNVNTATLLSVPGSYPFTTIKAKNTEFTLNSITPCVLQAGSDVHFYISDCIYSSMIDISGSAGSYFSIDASNTVFTWSGDSNNPLVKVGAQEGSINVDSSSCLESSGAFLTATTPISNTFSTIKNTSFVNTVNLYGDAIDQYSGCTLTTGSSSAILMNATGDVSFNSCTISSTANPAIAGTGVGTLTLGGITFTDNAIIAGTLTVAGSAAFLPAQFGTAGQVFTSNGPGVVPSFQDATAGGSTVISTQTFTSSGTYTPTAGMDYCIVELVGGGGGGGGAPPTIAGQLSAGSGGGAGGYARGIYSAGTIGASQAITIGAGGAGGAAVGSVFAGPGGPTSFGALMSATGGSGGVSMDLSTTTSDTDAGQGGIGSGGVIQSAGQAGGVSIGVSVSPNIATLSGYGGSSFFGGGATGNGCQNGNDPGNDAISYGSGGGGGNSVGATGGAGSIGGTGAPGVVIVTEFSGGGGGSGISTISGDTGSIAGSAVTIKAGVSTRNCGSTVKFVNSGATSTLNVSDNFNNIVIGMNSGNAGLSGALNTGLGVGVLVSTTSGTVNTALGALSLFSCISGQNNTGIGFEALGNVLTGNENTAIGSNSGFNYASSESNNILIKSSGVVGESNILRIGQATGASGNAVNKAFIQGIFNNDSSTFSTPLAVYVDSSTGQLGYGAGSASDLHVSKFIVSPGGSADGANYTTISSAIAAASGGDTIYVMDGTYVENITLKDRVNIVSFSSFQNYYGCNPNATIAGNVTDSGSGVNCSIVGLCINSTSGFAITTTAPGGVDFTNCRMLCENSLVSMNDGISNVYFDNCFINLNTTGSFLYNITAGDLWINNCYISGVAVTLPTMTDGAVEIVNSSISAPLRASGTSQISIRNSICGIDGVVAVTTVGSSFVSIRNSSLASGSASALSIGTGTTITATNNTITSSATNVFTGAGIIYTAGNACTSSSGNNVATINNLTVI